MTTVGLFLYPGCLPAGLFAFSDLLIAANQRLGRQVFAFQWLTPNGSAVPCANGQHLTGDAVAGAEIDALIMPGAWRQAENVPAPGDRALAETLIGLDSDIRLLSYCTGVCLAAETGRLDGRTATTTWWLAGRVSELYPEVRWKLTETLVFDHHASASGVNGHLPLGLALIEEQCGSAIANDIRNAMVLPRPGNRHTPFQTLTFLLQQGPLLRGIARWVEATPARDLTTERLADHLRMAPRTLARRVKAATGESCGHLIRQIKLNQVSDRLLTTSGSVNAISDELGYNDETSLRRTFKKVTGMTPVDYRRQYGN